MKRRRSDEFAVGTIVELEGVSCKDTDDWGTDVWLALIVKISRSGQYTLRVLYTREQLQCSLGKEQVIDSQSLQVFEKFPGMYVIGQPSEIQMATYQQLMRISAHVRITDVTYTHLGHGHLGPINYTAVATSSSKRFKKTNACDEEKKSCNEEKQGKEVGIWETKREDVCDLINELIERKLLSRVDIPEGQWQHENGLKGIELGLKSFEIRRAYLDRNMTNGSLGSIRLRMCSITDGKIYEGNASMLLASDLAPTGLPMRPLPSLPQHPKAQPAQQRSQWFAKEIATLTSNLSGGRPLVCVLEGRLENTLELIQCGIKPDQIITIERNMLACLFQQLAVRGTQLEPMHIFYSGRYQRSSSGGAGIESFIIKDLFPKHGMLDARDRIVGLYLDYCGDIPSGAILNSLVSSLPSLQLIGLTRGYRNKHSKHPFPSSPWSEFYSAPCVQTWKHPMVETRFWKRPDRAQRRDLLGTIPPS